MTEISAEMVRKLREATNVSMMECKRALVEAGGEMEKANRILRERGLAVANKKASRAANQGVIAAGTSPDGKTAVLVEVNCETDFVARNEGFQAFVKAIVAKALTTDAALASVVKDEVTAKVAEIGENIVVKRHTRVVRQGPGVLATYIHLGGKVGVIVELGCGKPETASKDLLREVAKDLTLHVAACVPKYLTAAEVPEAEQTAEREIYAKQVVDKPPQIVEKIVAGKLKKYLVDICLVDQPFVKEPKLSVTDLLNAKGKELGDALAVRRYVRFQLGE